MKRSEKQFSAEITVKGEDYEERSEDKYDFSQASEPIESDYQFKSEYTTKSEYQSKSDYK